MTQSIPAFRGKELNAMPFKQPKALKRWKLGFIAGKIKPYTTQVEIILQMLLVAWIP